MSKRRKQKLKSQYKKWFEVPSAQRKLLMESLLSMAEASLDEEPDFSETVIRAASLLEAISKQYDE